jgi:transketolase
MARRSEIDQLAINTIRMLAVDAVQKANSGHPGTSMDAAPTAYVLWQRFLRYDPADPHWLNRDRSSFRAATLRCCSTASYI